MEGESRDEWVRVLREQAEAAGLEFEDTDELDGMIRALVIQLGVNGLSMAAYDLAEYADTLRTLRDNPGPNLAATLRRIAEAATEAARIVEGRRDGSDGHGG